MGSRRVDAYSETPKIQGLKPLRYEPTTTLASIDLLGRLIQQHNCQFQSPDLARNNEMTMVDFEIRLCCRMR